MGVAWVVWLLAATARMWDSILPVTYLHVEPGVEAEGRQSEFSPVP